ncbi:MAG: hypothetical protein ACI9OJ_004005 [Myxococcota bacterium]|jgi:hypothetical protein
MRQPFGGSNGPLRVTHQRQLAANPDIGLPTMADTIRVPLGTLKDWMRGDQHSKTDVDERPGSDDRLESREPTLAILETVAAAWMRWDGSFSGFCDHVRHELRLPFGRTRIAEVLEIERVRQPKRRGRRCLDDCATRGTFETFFPGAQWIGDGKELTVDINGRRFVCNLELNVDVASGALVGASVRPTEDSAAVIEAFADGVATTGAGPLSLLLDNKPSNLHARCG